MRRELHAEWTKMRTVAGPAWLLLGVALLTVAVGAAASAVMTCPFGQCSYDPARISLSGVQLSQALVALLAIAVVSGEYSTGLIQTTLTAMPTRGRVLAAKAILVTGTTLAAGTAGVLGSILAARLILPDTGYTFVHGYALPSLTHGPSLRAAVGSVLYLGLIALLSVGIAAAVRDTAAATGSVLAVLYVPSLLVLISNPDMKEWIFRLAPTNAGLTIQATTDLAAFPISPWGGLGVFAAWATAAIALGRWLLRHRDA
ncbi:ABC transporter permease [Nonomuraea soli]|uniref:ABC-2 type transport system permease protein n=1 Tax=Nonomuraea soli TaxID=1032476 RepID=A0A7W0HST7_9ACTN|nr:ABC transporter permease [Nonomuraea soli]MBA2894011.1 ABC-2 type transport system permease protein [Nonomuraea soli]